MMYKVVDNLVHIPLANTVQLSYSRTRANHPLRNSNAYKHFLFPRVPLSGTVYLAMPSVQNQLGPSTLS